MAVQKIIGKRIIKHDVNSPNFKPPETKVEEVNGNLKEDEDVYGERKHTYQPDNGNLQMNEFMTGVLNKLDGFKLNLLDGLLNRMRLSPFQLEEKAFIVYLKRIEKFKPHYIYGYGQSIYQFSRYCHQNQIDLSCLKLKALILTGEMVFPDQIKTIKEVSFIVTVLLSVCLFMFSFYKYIIYKFPANF